MARTRHYSEFLTSWCSLVGVSTSRLSTTMASVANTTFNTAIKNMWSLGPWLDICPYGEARFAGNKITYPNNIANTAWTKNDSSATANSLVNPLDGATTASQLLEAATTAAHNVTQSFSILPSTQYIFSAYVRPNGRNYCYLLMNDGTTSFSAFYNLSTGAVGTVTNATSTSIALQPNGFYLCKMTFTSTNTTVLSKNYQLSISTDGYTLSYAGDVTKGIYVWGAFVQQVSNTTAMDSLVAWEQLGESAVDVVFNVWRNSPLLSIYPTGQGYTLTPNGIQLISSAGNTTSYTNGVPTTPTFPVSNNPVFLYYRRVLPSFTGDVYSASLTYSVDQQMYFTNSLGTGDFYKCLVATSAGQSPDTTAASWEIIPLYDVFLQYCVYQAYGDWLISDGQMDKSVGAYTIAQSKMDTEFDKMERQQGDVLPMKVSTHLTSRSGFNTRH